MTNTPRDFVSVPREATEEMRQAGLKVYATKDWRISDVYKAMIESAPTPPVAVEDAQSESGWVIERGDSDVSRPFYWGGCCGWTYSNLNAVRFARKEDAESVDTTLQWERERKKYTPIKNRIAEHGWPALATPPSTVTSREQGLERAIKRLLAANAALGQIENGLTLYEGSPTKSQRCYEAWLELNDAGKEAKALIGPSLKLRFTDEWLREKIMQVPDGIETEAGEPTEGRALAQPAAVEVKTSLTGAQPIPMGGQHYIAPTAAQNDRAGGRQSFAPTPQPPTIDAVRDLLMKLAEKRDHILAYKNDITDDAPHHVHARAIAEGRIQQIEQDIAVITAAFPQRREE